MERGVTIAARIAGALVVLILLIVVIGAWQYFTWCSRGDEIAFSPTGDLGWGSRPYYMHDRNKAPHRVGTVESYLFIAHGHIDNDVAGELAATKH